MSHTSSQVDTTNIQALFVAWQEPKSKQYFPVGRLLRLPNGHGPTYEFCYLNGVAKAQLAGFTAFLAFPELSEVYRSHELFPLFSNRLMPRSRPDFGKYVARLDLDPNNADDFAILGRSGGRRVTDSLELFPLPNLEHEGCYITYFLAHGIRYLPDTSINRLEMLQEGDRLRLQWDMDNEADPRALSLRTEDRIQVGYVPRYLLDDAWEILMTCPYRPTITVAQVNHPPGPIQQRLLCRMESCWPEGFKPYCSDDYLPMVNTATKLGC
jgi:HIRAN domain